ncbi:DUF7002 family protein [Methylotuvimicrobium sp. KM1]|uniref:DUF7002 family protein n=1 Tax=Methylotuvimicrobium sp. KM1 TaxID=3377707 RepID=UPI00384C1A95
MSLTIASLTKSRKFAYHVCSEVNFEAIRASLTLQSACELLQNTQFQHLLLGKRLTTQNININGRVIQVRDHKPLVEANIELIDSCTFNDFIQELNSRVFLWAGTELGPCKSGRNHIRKYQNKGSVYILRIPTTKLLETNGVERFKVTFCNSGSARQNNGQKARRGHSTFLRLEQSTQPPGKVVELTFQSFVKLPPKTEYAEALVGPWSTLKADT